ncbi:zinc-ribbon domain-containing protein [Acinetobacter wanghuae]|uniref:Zinc-ribbon domain-containing protein n=1 Tax=Acinetobacter wanghuae TaxID=2662362 RepID=A0A5Q0P4H8_9GAMM|nr:zinc-ribbon domain-containing protein [Acinetobacter wanghuae]MQW92352.1 zinc-ribbon domain-containing protein [Acinetobacter wanghuae]QGA12065.1 zinc-ribbon domain-containing protein [Acinetobacter wanghuae]
MFFIFGLGPKTKVIETNQFVCPVCRTRSSYELKQQRNYFSLFFIPLIPLSKPKNSFVQCLNCRTQMPSTVLDHAQPNV